MRPRISATDRSNPDRWIAQARSGSSEALDRLIDLLTQRFFDELGGRNLRGMSPANTISDLIQETVLRAREKFSAFDKDTFEEFERWADGILRNKYLHWMRNHRQRNSEAKHLAIWRAIKLRRNLPDQTCRLRSEEDAVARREEAARAYSLFEQKLKPNEQYIMRLRLFEGLRFKQIAALVNSTEDAVAKAHRRALARLRTFVERDGTP